MAGAGGHLRVTGRRVATRDPVRHSGRIRWRPRARPPAISLVRSELNVDDSCALAWRSGPKRLRSSAGELPASVPPNVSGGTMAASAGCRSCRMRPAVGRRARARRRPPAPRSRTVLEHRNHDPTGPRSSSALARPCPTPSRPRTLRAGDAESLCECQHALAFENAEVNRARSASADRRLEPVLHNALDDRPEPDNHRVAT